MPFLCVLCQSEVEEEGFCSLSCQFDYEDVEEFMASIYIQEQQAEEDAEAEHRDHFNEDGTRID